MLISIKTKIWNRSLFVFLVLVFFSFGVLAVANESETITAYFEDVDQDGLSIEEEKAFGTDPTNSDTDGDSYSDGVEVESGYDPLKPAPGDRIVPEESSTSASDQKTDQINLTDVAREELAAVVSEKQDTAEELTTDDLNAAVTKVMENASEEIELPAIDESSIKIKELPDDLDDEEEREQKREDTLEYLTTVSYILLSNAPVPIRSQEDLASFANSSFQDATVALTTGNFDFLDEIETKGERALEEIQSVEVPENMVDTHVKAIKTVKLFSTLGEKIRSIDPVNDPLGQMFELSKLQGAITQVQSFLGDTTQMMTGLGITNIPLDL